MIRVTPEVRSWQAIRDRIARSLETRTGHDVDAWNRRILHQRFSDEDALRRWLKNEGVTGYGQMLLVWERFGYPAYITAGPDDLIAGQYADRQQLRPIFDATVAVLPRIGDVAIQARKGYVCLVSKRRTFAVIQATTKNRVDLGLRLANVKPGGRLETATGLGNSSFSVRVGLTSPADLDAQVLRWLKRAYQENS